jgi:UDP-N-acetylmuramoylalanine--D-glutamate ligase
MILIYWKWKVGSAVASLCEYQHIPYEIYDDSDILASYDKYEVIIPSPWIPSSHQIYTTGKVLAELDFAYRYMPKGFQVISVTGTDGKSTTSWIAYSILQKEFFGKKSIYLSGNFDIPFSETVLNILEKWEKRWVIVLEVSSFMSYAIETFTSDYSIFTNFKPDHLNWHRDLEEYLDAKMRLFHHTSKKSIINNQVIDFSKKKNLKINIPENTRVFQDGIGSKDCIHDNDIIISWRKKYNLSETHFSWGHNAMNILSVGLVANEMKICSKRIKRYLSEIKWLPHRLEIIGERKWITIVEDSKSTSSQSLEAALSSFWNNKNLLLIAWGSNKWDSFAFLSQRFAERVKAMICIWATKSQFEHIAISQNIPYLVTDSLDDGVRFLLNQWESWDILMLSPGCASFWLFRDYLDRANQFREAIKKIPN